MQQYTICDITVRQRQSSIIVYLCIFSVKLPSHWLCILLESLVVFGALERGDILHSYTQNQHICIVSVPVSLIFCRMKCKTRQNQHAQYQWLFILFGAQNKAKESLLLQSYRQNQHHSISARTITLFAISICSANNKALYCALTGSTMTPFAFLSYQ